MEIKVKKLTETAKLPTRGSKFSAGYDLYADIKEKIMLAPHQTVKISTGLSFQLPEGYFGAIFARSGLATKEDMAPANMVGVCDSDYTGEYIVAIRNYGESLRIIEPGERIAQLIVMPFLPVDFTVVDELDVTERGSGGFGSTGK
jgi:dUTP pyrophosphatase